MFFPTYSDLKLIHQWPGLIFVKMALLFLIYSQVFSCFSFAHMIPEGDVYYIIWCYISQYLVIIRWDGSGVWQVDLIFILPSEILRRISSTQWQPGFMDLFSNVRRRLCFMCINICCNNCLQQVGWVFWEEFCVRKTQFHINNKANKILQHSVSVIRHCG